MLIRIVTGVLLGIGLILPAFAQLEVTFPSTRAVFQRNNSNETTLYVGGNYQDCLDRVEARVVARAVGQGTSTAWTIIQNTPSGGQFYGSFVVKGGWYNLEVRGIRDEGVVASSLVERVGVGEVFLIAGQSNATGGDGLPNGPGATDDRVSSVDFQNIDPTSGVVADYQDVKLPCPVFVHLKDTVNTAPFGNYAWCWGSFGDQMVSRLNVPVLIFNAGWSGTSIYNWRETLDPNASTISYYGITYPVGLPYGHLRLALNNYIAQQGYRAVLWQQGENDSFAEITRESYRNDLRAMIEASRSLSNKSDLAWVVARVSRMTKDGVSRIWQPLIDAQNDVIGNNGADPTLYLPHVFSGPNTDPLEGPAYRTSDNIHFTGNGLVLLAEAWKNALSDPFFSSSTPYMPTPPPSIAAACAGNNALTLTAPAGWALYEWQSFMNCNQPLATGQTWTATSGRYVLKVKDSFQNTVLSPQQFVPASTEADVAIAGNSNVAAGGTISLTTTTSDACTYAWTGPSGYTGTLPNVSISNANSSHSGNYQVTVTNNFGCQAQSTFNVMVGSEIGSVGSGNWNSPSTWSCGCVPSSSADIVIRNGHTVTIDGISVQARSIRYEQGTVQLTNNGNLHLAQ